ncbi:MAG: alpha/beta hydrolase [Chloroflexota bacterium]
MEKLRKYGSKPFDVAVIHGGPGAPGEVAPLARKLASIRGVLEPFQAADTCEGQVQELKAVLEENGDLPVTLIGHSWGAMLSFMVAARYPALVKKLIMVSSAVFEDEYATEIEITRLTRLNDEERVEAISLLDALSDTAREDKDESLSRLVKLLWTKADSYDPLPFEDEVLEVQYDVNINVMEGAKKLRGSGELLELGKRIKCPVVAIHGDYDSHPAEGVKEPLSRILKDFRLIRLEKCGHFPWLERQARGRFYEILKKEIA